MPETIVLVHGLWMNSAILSLLGLRLGRQGFAIASFTYPTVRAGMSANTQLLHEFIGTLGRPPVHIVGHSLGGVLALHLLQEYPGERVGRVVCLGSPLTDSAAFRNLQRRSWGRKIVGKTLTDAMQGGGLHTLPREIDVGSIAGRLPFGVGRVSGKLPAPHDGVVSVAETRLSGITEQITLPVTHTGLVLSRTVAAQTAHFLRHGKFL